MKRHHFDTTRPPDWKDWGGDEAAVFVWGIGKPKFTADAMVRLVTDARNRSQIRQGDRPSFIGVSWFECESPGAVLSHFRDENASVPNL